MEFFRFLAHERFRLVKELRLPIGVEGDITLQWLRGVLPNLDFAFLTRWIPVSGNVINVVVPQNGGNVLALQAIEQYKSTHPCNPFQAWIKWESNGRIE